MNSFLLLIEILSNPLLWESRCCKTLATHSALGVMGECTDLPTRSLVGKMSSSLCLLEESVAPLPHVPMRGGIGQSKASASLKESVILCLPKGRLAWIPFESRFG